MPKKVINFSLTPESSNALDVIAKAAQSNRSVTVEDSIFASVILMRLGRQALLEAIRTIRDRGIEQDPYVGVQQDDNGDPLVHLVFGHGEDANVSGLKAKGEVVGDRCYVFLDFGDLPLKPAAIKIGAQVIRVPVAQLHIDSVSWPPRQGEAFRIPLGRYLDAELAEPDPLLIADA